MKIYYSFLTFPVRYFCPSNIIETIIQLKEWEELAEEGGQHCSRMTLSQRQNGSTLKTARREASSVAGVRGNQCEGLGEVSRL